MFDNLEEIRPYIRTDLAVPVLEQPASDLAKEFEKSPYLKGIMETQALREKMTNILEFGKSPQYIQWFRDYTNELINQGVDLDSMSEGEFRTLFISNCIQRFFVREISDISKLILESIQNEKKEYDRNG